MSIQDRLQGIRLRFLDKMPARIQEMRNALGGAQSKDHGSVEAFYRTAHSLYGTSGSLGLAEIARVAQALEGHAINLRKGTPLTSELVQTLTELIQQLESLHAQHG